MGEGLALDLRYIGVDVRGNDEMLKKKPDNRSLEAGEGNGGREQIRFDGSRGMGRTYSVLDLPRLDGLAVHPCGVELGTPPFVADARPGEAREGLLLLPQR